MRITLMKFPALFCATIFMLMGSSLFITYIALNLDQKQVSSVWIGGMIAAYYIGMAFGAKIDNIIISHVGHIRTYVACAAISTITVLLHLLFESLPLWLMLRFIMGMAMMGQFIVIESWLNDQVENHQRGIIMAGYMTASSFGQVVGQLLIGKFPLLSFKPVLLVAICFCISLIPVAMTRRMYPEPQKSVSMELTYFIKQIPQPLIAVLISGIFVGTIYGLAPVYANQVGLSNIQISYFLSMIMLAGALAQWPMGWLSDRVNRGLLLQKNTLIFAILIIPLWGIFSLSYSFLLIFAFILGIFAFTFYPLSVSFANDDIDPAKRISLSTLMLVTYSIGASMGPIVIGLIMKLNSGALFITFSVISICFSLWLKTIRQNNSKNTLPS
ncbi:MFS transporter [Neisseria sp. Ec49-e6-T10]|uniref:MFS transporter n=1 Tax=Neisseria sp. Ec49-e6-T10 TaxID=3140744 RepID=UPI003EB85B99